MNHSILIERFPLQDAAGIHTDDSIVSLILNRAEQANAFNGQMIEEITDNLSKLLHESTVRLIIIQGAGKHFSAGADLHWMQQSAKLSYDENVREAELMANMFETLAAMPMPTISVVRGSAYGGAMGLIAASDVVIATETARFALSEVRLGLMPAVILPYLTRRISQGHLRRLALSGRVFSTKEARDINLVQVSCTTDSLPATLADEVAQLLLSSPEAQVSFKRLLQRVEEEGRKQGRYTAKAIAEARASDSGQAGLRAFLGKKSCNWIRQLPSNTVLVRDA